MRIVFLGSGAFAIPCFEALIDAGHHVVALVTQPDRTKGRGRELAPPATKPIAQARGVRVFQPARIREPQAQAELRNLAPEVQVVVAYGQILPNAVIEIPPRGTLNVHGSLLPRLRGAAPIQWAIVNGERETGVTTMLIDEGLDTGPVLLSRATSIGPDETAADLEPRLSLMGAAVLIETLAGLADGSVRPEPQDHTRATLAPLLHKQDGRLDWSLDATSLARRIRGFNPWPGTFTMLDRRTLKVLRARPAEPAEGGQPGRVAAVDADGIVVHCGSGTRLRLLEVQPESRRPMSAAGFAAGARLVPGVLLHEAAGGPA